MGILDEAIREHLDLKRSHGAEEPELKQLEDEALGPPGGPGDTDEPPEMSDAEAEAPTDYIGSPAAAPAEDETDVTATPGSEAGMVPSAAPEAPTPAPDMRPPEMRPEEDAPSTSEAEEAEAPAEPEPAPAEEEHPAMEHEVVSDAPAPAEPAPQPSEEAPPGPASAQEPEQPPVEAGGISSDLRAEREQIAQHPTEHYDVEGEIAESEKEAAGFFNEQSLSDELDQALDSPESDNPAAAPSVPSTEDPIDDDDDDEIEIVEEVEVVEVVEAPEETPVVEEDEAEADDAEEGHTEEQERQPEPEQASASPTEEVDEEDGDEDVLEETPEFLQDTPEHDRLWFEQKPPKDFDFDD